MLRRFKDAVKFNFTVSPDDVTLECLNKWEPHLLAVTCTRRSKKRSTKPIAWERSTENPGKLVVRWSLPENLEMMVTFYRDTDKTHFDDKEWNFILEEIDGARRKPLASEVINLASLAAVSQAEQKSLVLKLRPISSKIGSAELALTLSWVFVKAGNSKDDDMQSVASFDAISNSSYDESHGSLKRNHHGGSDAGAFGRLTPGRSTTSFETGRRFANFFKSHRNKEKSGKGANMDGTRTLPLPMKSAQKPTVLETVVGSSDNQSSEGTIVTSISVTASVHSDLAQESVVDSPSQKETVIKRSALPNDLLKSLAERQKEMASKKVRPVYEGTPPSSPDAEEKPLPELLPPPSELDPSPLHNSTSIPGNSIITTSSSALAGLPLSGAIATLNPNSSSNIEPSSSSISNDQTVSVDTNNNNSSDPAQVPSSEGASNSNGGEMPAPPSEVNLQSLDLLEWCKQVTSGYPGVCVTNLTTSWRNGLAFAAAIHHFRPDLIDWDELIKAQSQSQLVYRRVLDAVLALNVTSLPWEHGSTIDLNAVPDRLLVTKFLYELRQKLSNPNQEPEIEHMEFEPEPPEPISNSSMESSTESRQQESSSSKNRLSPSADSTSRPRVVSPVLGSAPKPAPGTPLMTHKQYFNPLDSDDEDSTVLNNLFINKPPPVPQRSNAPAPSPAQQVSPAKTPTVQRAASSPKMKIRVIKPNNANQSGSTTVLEGSSSVSSSADSSSMTLPKVVEVPSAEVMAPKSSPRIVTVRHRPSPPVSPKVLAPANSDSNLTAKTRLLHNSSSGNQNNPEEQVLPPRKNSTSSSGSTSRLRDVLSSRPILTFPDEIDHVPLPIEPDPQPGTPPSPPPPKPPHPETPLDLGGDEHENVVNGQKEVNGGDAQMMVTSNGLSSSSSEKARLRSGVSMLVDVEPGEQEALARQQAAIEKETADIQNLLQRMALTGDRELEPTLLQRLFVLVNRKDAIVRRKFQVDLVEKERQLMQQRDEIEQQLRQLLANEDRTNRNQALEADLMNRLRAVVLERESVVEQLDLQTAEIEHDEEMSSMNRIVVRAFPAAETNSSSEYQRAAIATVSNGSRFLQAQNQAQPAMATNGNQPSSVQSIASAASPRLGRFFAQRASAFRGWLSGST